MVHPSSTRDWLDTRDDAQLYELLELRPEVLLGATVADLDDLALRLEHPASVSAVLMKLPRPAFEVLEVLTALDFGANRERVLELLDGAGDTNHVRAAEHWLGVLEATGLAWDLEGCSTVNPGVREVLVNPLALGPPARAVAEHFTADRLKRLYQSMGVRPSGRKAELVAGIGSLYANPSRIRQTVGAAPDEVAQLLTEHIATMVGDSLTGDPVADDEDEPWTPEHMQRLRARQQMLRWALEHGIALGQSYGYGYTDAVFPAEVVLALAPPTYRAPFHPEPPPLPTVEVSAEQSERTSAAAITAALAAIMAVLETTARTPLAILKSGGVGVRELVKVAKSVGVEVAEVRLALELAADLGLLARTGARIGMAREFETWRQRTPAERAADLLATWWGQTTPPTRERDDDDKARPALRDGQMGGTPPMTVIASLLQDMDSAAIVGVEPVLERIGWMQPLARPPEENLRCTWSEAERFGAVGNGRLTRLGQALHAGDRAPVLSLLEELLPEQSGEVLFGADLTVVVPGSPGAAVVDLLDTVATRESHGVGATWRVSEASVRDALDRGYTVETLLGELRQVSSPALPQPLEYVLHDVARRHGHLAVQPAGCVIVSEDESLIAEVAATRLLDSLGLVAVAPTVLAGSADPTTALAALRKAGYLPVEMDDDGARTIQLRARGPMGEKSAAAADAAGTTSAATAKGLDEVPVDEEFESGLATFMQQLELHGLAEPDGARSMTRPEPEEPAALVARLRRR